MFYCINGVQNMIKLKFNVDWYYVFKNQLRVICSVLYILFCYLFFLFLVVSKPNGYNIEEPLYTIHHILSLTIAIISDFLGNYSIWFKWIKNEKVQNILLSLLTIICILIIGYFIYFRLCIYPTL